MVDRYPQEWNFATKHPMKRELANEDEQRIYMKLNGGCLHTMWTREQYPDGMRLAICVKCGAMEDIGRDKTEYEPADPVKSDREIREMFLRRLPNFRYDDVVANKVFRTIEAAGWHCIVHSKDDQFACLMSKGAERFLSASYTTKSAAITNAAGQVLMGKWPR
jgi:hypothetical protein